MKVIQVELTHVGSNLCPLEAWRKFRGVNKLGENHPVLVLRWENSQNLTLSKRKEEDG